MKLSEIILDGIIRTSLFEMANDRAIIIQGVHNLTPNIILHLVKILMFGEECVSVNHWCSEINAALRKIQLNKLKGSHKPLNSEKLYDIMFIGPLGHTSTAEEWMSVVWDEQDSKGKFKYRKLPIQQPSGTIIHGALEKIISKVSVDISKQAFKDIRNYL